MIKWEGDTHCVSNVCLLLSCLVLIKEKMRRDGRHKGCVGCPPLRNKLLDTPALVITLILESHNILRAETYRFFSSSKSSPRQVEYEIIFLWPLCRGPDLTPGVCGCGRRIVDMRDPVKNVAFLPPHWTSIHVSQGFETCEDLARNVKFRYLQNPVSKVSFLWSPLHQIALKFVVFFSPKFGMKNR